MLRVIVKKAPPFVVIASPELYMTTIVYEISISKQSKKEIFFWREVLSHNPRMNIFLRNLVCFSGYFLDGGYSLSFL